MNKWWFGYLLYLPDSIISVGNYKSLKSTANSKERAIFQVKLSDDIGNSMKMRIRALVGEDLQSTLDKFNTHNIFEVIYYQSANMYLLLLVNLIY